MQPTSPTPPPESSSARAPVPTEGFGHSKRRIVVELGVVLGLAALVVGAAVWVGHRASGWAVQALPLSLDETVGEVSWKLLAAEPLRCTDPSMQQYVEKLLAPLIEAAADPRFEFQIAVIDNDDPNAFALPGGFLTVHSGLLTTASSGDEVAGVLAHEIAHATRRHGMSRIVREAGVSIALGLVLGFVDLSALTGYGAQLANLSYDRDQESEADAVGREYLLRAGIDPRGLADFFTKLEERGGPGAAMPTILSTHPDLRARIQATSTRPPAGFQAKQLPRPEGLRCHGESDDEDAARPR